MYTGLYIILILILILWVLTIKKTILNREGKPYLIRWTLLKCSLFSLKVHKILISDEAEPHDHPWNYVSIILWGGYCEVEIIRYNEVELFLGGNKSTKIVFIQDGNILAIAKTWYKPISILYRKGNKLHRLIIPEGKFCLSLVLTTKKYRKWGFLKDGKWESHENLTY